MPRTRECPMKHLWFRAEMTSEDIIDLWRETHVVPNVTEDGTDDVLEKEVLLELDPSWKPSQVSRVEEEEEEKEEEA